jgi:hypothetical protein
VQVDLAGPCADAATIAARIEGVLDPTFEQPTGSGGLVLRYRTTQPERTNPRVIAALVAAGAAIVSVTCTRASLEDVYATALRQELEPVAASGARL